MSDRLKDISSSFNSSSKKLLRGKSEEELIREQQERLIEEQKRKIQEDKDRKERQKRIREGNASFTDRFQSLFDYDEE